MDEPIYLGYLLEYFHTRGRKLYLPTMVLPCLSSSPNQALICLIFLLISACSRPPVLKPFTSDACSFFPDRDSERGDSWCECCAEHDLAYWKGGTNSERLTADLELKDCIVRRTQDSTLANLIYSGVRFGGSPRWPTWYRWGYGWPYIMKNLPDSLRLQQIRARSNFDRPKAIKAACED